MTTLDTTLDTTLPAADGLDNPTLALGLSGVSDFATGMPFLDLMKMSRPWIGHSPASWTAMKFDALREGGYLDADGWPTRIPDGLSSVGTVWDWSGSKTDADLASTRAGVYVVTWDGEGTLRLSGDVKILSQENGRIVFENLKGGTMMLDIMATDPKGNGNYIRDISVVEEKYETLHEMGQTFNPEWLSLVQDARELRFMTWMKTNDLTTTVDWADRPQAGDVTWTTQSGVPLEVMVELANQTGSEPWFNIPAGATDNYIRQFAIYVRDHLDPRLQAHVEFANEAWNGSLASYHVLNAASKAAWGVSAPFDYYAKRATETAVIWEDVFGDQADARVDNVLGGQTANAGIASRILGAPIWLAKEPDLYVSPASVFDSVAVTTYFGNSVMGHTPKRLELLEMLKTPGVDVTAWLAAKLMDPSYENSIPYVAAQWQANKAVADKFGLDLVAYEGGQHVLQSFGLSGINAEDMTILTNFLSQFVRSTAMAELYRALWVEWAKVSDGPFMHFGDVAASSKFGAWGLFTSLADTNPRAELLMELNAHSTAWFGDGGGEEYQQGVIKIGTAAGDTLVGTDMDDFLIGDTGGDTFYAGKGHDAIAGDGGRDKLVLEGAAEDYVLAAEGQGYRLSGPGLSHYLKDIEVFRFDDDIDLTLAGMLSLAQTTAKTLTGTAGDDQLTGGKGDDSFTNSLGSDTLVGGFGSDILKLEGKASDYTLIEEGAGYRLTGEGVSHYLQGIETFAFTRDANRTLEQFVEASLNPGPLVVASRGVIADSSGIAEVQITASTGVVVRGIAEDSLLGRTLGIDANGTLAEYTVAEINASATFGTTRTFQSYWSMQEDQRNAASTTPLTGDVVATALKLGSVLTSVHALTLTDGDDRFYGLYRTDAVDGGAGDDMLYGRRGNDTLLGGSGQDTLNGGFGDDAMTGGAGADRFYVTLNSNLDVITDFSSEDVLDMVGAGVTSRAALAASAHEDDQGNLVIGNDRHAVTLEGLHLSDFGWMNIAI